MRRILWIICFVIVSVLASAQTQQGEVKTRGRMENGVLKPGKGLAGATVYVTGRQAVRSEGDAGRFSFPVTGQKFRIEKVQKQGYQLIDYSVCTEYRFSANPLRLVMDVPGQQQADLLAKERNLRRSLQRKLQQREDEVEALNISLEEKNRLLQEINQEREESEKIIKDLAKYYATLDYDQLDEFQQKVNDCLERGELEKADSLLRSQGDMTSRIEAVKAEQAAEDKEEAELSQRQKDLETSKAGTKKRIESIAADCYSFHQRFMQDHQRDSAAYYLELRASLDTTNVEWSNQAGLYNIIYLANYAKAMEYFQRVLRLSLQQYGEQSDWIATAYNNIGSIYSDLGDKSKALEYYTKALAIKEDTLGVESHNIATYYNNIGSIYCSLADYPKALDYFIKALTIREKVFGSRHPDVASSYNNIGVVFNELGNYSRALDYHMKALTIREKVFGTDNPDVATSYINIGNDYNDMGDYYKALDYYTKALAIREKVYGIKHPDVASSYDNIGNLYYDLTEYAKALEYYNKALSIYEYVFGTEHSDVATSYNNIGLAYNDIGDYAKAIEYHIKSLNITEKMLGTEHPNVAISYGNIGKASTDLCDYAKALEYYSKALEIFKKVFGQGHPHVGRTYNNIGDIHYRQSDYSKALEYYTKALTILEKAYGTEHPDVATLYNSIGYVYEDQGYYSKALEYYTKTLDIYNKSFGSDHQKTKEILDNIRYVKESIIVKDTVAMQKYVFIATVIDKDTPAHQQGMSGEYVVLEYADWAIKEDASLFDKSDEKRGKPKDIVVMKDDIIKEYHFENKIGVKIKLKEVGKDEKLRIIKKYEEWKQNNQ